LAKDNITAISTKLSFITVTPLGFAIGSLLLSSYRN